MGPIDGAVVLVTGATGGIGRAIAVRLAGRGARLVLCGRDRDALTEVVATTSGRLIAADLAEPEGIERVAAEALASHGRVDVLVNNAGVGFSGETARMEWGIVDDLVAVNLLAPIRLTRALLPHMLDRGGGHVVNVGSIAGHVGVGGEAVYAATKAGLHMFTESLRYELAGTGVGVSLMSPGAVDTPFFARRGAPYARSFPKPIPPERVARAIVRAIETGRPEVFVPRWMVVPARLRGAWPRLYRALAGRFG